MKKETWILGIQITDRLTRVMDVQSVLTKYGCSIKTRLGLHDVVDDHCSPEGLVILELTGQTEEFYKLENELLAIPGINVKKMVFPEQA
jgi:hypothetical protein